jgi:ABC-2 type transport system permease protein
MKIFWAISKVVFKQSFQYRLGQMLSIVIYPLYLLVFIAVFTGLYTFSGVKTLAGYDLTRMIWYQAGVLFIGTISWNNTDWQIANRIISGNMVQDLLKPVSVFKFQLALAVGHRLFAVVGEILPAVIILPLLYFPSFIDVGCVLRFIPVALGAFFLTYHINFLIGLLAFAMKSTASIQPIRVIISWTLGGGRIPLDFFPPFFVTLNAFLPFQYCFYYPIRVLLNMPGASTPTDFLTVVGAQAGWIAGLHILCRLFWRGAYRQFCAVG